MYPVAAPRRVREGVPFAREGRRLRVGRRRPGEASGADSGARRGAAGVRNAEHARTIENISE